MTTVTNTSVVGDSADRRRRIWAIFGSSSGNLVEWYDFYAYAFTALYFAPAFFPKGNQTTQLLQTAAVFAIGFLMRPIGGYLFGFIADKYGRKTSMLISVLMMCAGLSPLHCCRLMRRSGPRRRYCCCWPAWCRDCRSAASTAPAQPI